MGNAACCESRYADKDENKEAKDEKNLIRFTNNP